ncbi:hypothetical protein A1O1_06611 [Capronia coronata CBS 617.96]|uniref:Uncharacterized protein n=1 Tax=Capronia coronata CBS 617.96 TaxID=1182541 RepID=W9YAE7_9EURO|nr:uncharacterized protein A1O1_06611 [Capronia coronata CBS 617.96]EXJ86241.1 hypothetical protein A1O1_06611 [Capronia coronata CBS 617.96]
MRRRTRGAFLNLLLFIGALSFIFYLNGTGSGGGGSGSSRPAENSFAWSTIRYRSTSTTLPEARGICPSLAADQHGHRASKPALVVARVTADGDTKWLDALKDKYHLCVYTADKPLDKKSTYLQVPANRGHEAMAYLTFLIDNYAHLPAAGAVFIHGSRWAWHNDMPDYDNAAALAALNVSAALAPTGYHNLRCDWSASTCPTSSTSEQVVAQGSLSNSIRAMLEPWNQRVVSDAALPHALATLFGGNDYSSSASNAARVLLARNDAVRSQCCAQFVVSRERIWQHSRDEYVALRQWLLDGSDADTEGGGEGGSHPASNNIGAAAPADDRIAGRILSYLWHILFIRPCNDSAEGSSCAGDDGLLDLDRLNTLACPSAAECYCRLYGRCNLQGCTSPGSCQGQYMVPPHFRLPDDWAATHL